MGKYVRHLIAAGVALLVGAVVSVTGVTPDPDQVNTIVDGLASNATEFLMLVVYAFGEKLLKRFPLLDKEGFIDWLWLKREAATTTTQALKAEPRP